MEVHPSGAAERRVERLVVVRRREEDPSLLRTDTVKSVEQARERDPRAHVVARRVLAVAPALLVILVVCVAVLLWPRLWGEVPRDAGLERGVDVLHQGDAPPRHV